MMSANKQQRSREMSEKREDPQQEEEDENILTDLGCSTIRWMTKILKEKGTNFQVRNEREECKRLWS